MKPGDVLTLYLVALVRGCLGYWSTRRRRRGRPMLLGARSLADKYGVEVVQA